NRGTTRSVHVIVVADRHLACAVIDMYAVIPAPPTAIPVIDLQNDMVVEEFELGDLHGVPTACGGAVLLSDRRPFLLVPGAGIGVELEVLFGTWQQYPG